MTSLPMAPTTTPESNRFKRPWTDSSRTMRVPLWTEDPEGEFLEGKVVVPLRLCFTQEHTNERLEFNKLMGENIERWAEWRRQRGWEMSSRPHVRGPFFPPESGNAKTPAFFEKARKAIGAGAAVREIVNFDHPEDVRWYFVRARFKRTAPVFARLDDMLWLQETAALYAAEPVVKDTGPINPLEYAEARRQRLGLKVKDYRMGRIQDPL